MIVLENAKKQLGDFRLDVSLACKPGQITGLVGKNGAGKSTTIKMILGLLEADSGRVETLGKPAQSLSPAEKSLLGVALAETGFNGTLTVKDVAKILGKFYPDCSPAEFCRSAKQQGLPLDKKLSTFSTGMKAKLRVLVALSHKAKLLILDEPTAGLDVEARNEVLDMLRDYMARQEDSAILISSHIASDLEGLCDELYLIHKGKILLHEETHLLLGQYGVLKVSPEQYEALEKKYILNTRKQPYGYACFTNQKQYYLDNCPGIVVEQAGIDQLILIMTGGER